MKMKETKPTKKRRQTAAYRTIGQRRHRRRRLLRPIGQGRSGGEREKSKSGLFLRNRQADAIMLKLKDSNKLEELAQPTLLITADSVVVCKGEIREKPSSKEEAHQFIRDYSGGSAEVVGSVLVTNLVTGSRKGGWESAEVFYEDIPDKTIDSLIEEGLILNVAGALMLEHPLTFPLVKKQVGGSDCIMGLPKGLTEKLIQEAL